MTVAASSLDRRFLGQVKLSNRKTFRGATLFSTNQKKTMQLPLAYKETAGRNKTSAEYCLPGSLSPSLVKGKIVICKRGINYKELLWNQQEELECYCLTLHLMGRSLQPILMFYQQAYWELLQLGPSKVICLETKIYQLQLIFLVQHLELDPPRWVLFHLGSKPHGPPYIKPDITAPGINILAAWPPISSITEQDTDDRRADFNILWGTSMSCPHVSGVAALVKSVHRDWSPAMIKSAIMTSAYTQDNTGNPISDLSESFRGIKSATPFSFGSGHVDPHKALDPGLVYDITGEDYLQYLCSINHTNAEVTIVARRNYTCPKQNVLQPGDLNCPSFAVLFAAAKRAKTSTSTYKRTVTNVGTGNITYNVQLDQPKGTKISVVPKVLKFKDLDEKLHG